MLRKFVIIFITPLLWKFFSKRKVLALQEFSAIEKDSGCQLLWSLELTRDAKDRAFIFQHVLEEFFHAEIFEDISQYYATSYLPRVISAREILIDKKSTPEQVWDFFSYAHVGEEGVNRDFSYYAKAKLEKKISAVFLRVSVDESNHIHGTKEILENMTKDRKFFCQWLIVKSTVKRKIKQMQSSTRFIGGALLTLVLTLVYYVFGFLVHKTLKNHLLAMDRKEVIALMKLQEADV